jgi:formate-dependent nitrite reductase membrane component NrfD
MTADQRLPEQPPEDADRRSDVRGLDRDLALLQGEAVTQSIRETATGQARRLVWQNIPAMTREDPTYYDRPVIKEPVWNWSVPTYFYAGGAAGAASVLGAVAQLIDREGLSGLVKRCRWVAAGGTALGTAALIYDLGRPERFLNMLRVFRPTSPLNVGSWVLAAMTPLSGSSAVLAGTGGAVRSIGDFAALGSGTLGVPLAGYTSVVLTNTAVPSWLQIRRSLPALFYASAASSAACLLEATKLSEREGSIVRRFGLLGKMAELASSVLVQRELSEIEPLGKTLTEGFAGSLWISGRALTGGSAALSFFAKTRKIKVLSAVLGSAGAVAIRFAVFHAGKASTRDPRATFHQQRS